MLRNKTIRASPEAYNTRVTRVCAKKGKDNLRVAGTVGYPSFQKAESYYFTALTPKKIARVLASAAVVTVTCVSAASSPPRSIVYLSESATVIV